MVRNGVERGRAEKDKIEMIHRFTGDFPSAIIAAKRGALSRCQ